MSSLFPVRTPKQVVREVCEEALELQDDIRRVLGRRADALFRSIQRHHRSLVFSEVTSDAAFDRNDLTGQVTFFNGGFYALRNAVEQLAGAEVDRAYLHRISDAAYAWHELHHIEQGLAHFSVVQDHKRVPQGLDEIGKLDHIADNNALCLIAALLAAHAGNVSRKEYLKYFRDLSVLLNMAAPLAFGLADQALHKQKRRLANWMGAARVDDALAYGMVDEIEHEVGPVDSALWMHFQKESGEIVVWEPEPRHRVLGTARVKPDVLLKALQYREHMDRGEMLTVVRMFLQSLQIDAASVQRMKDEQASPPQVS